MHSALAHTTTLRNQLWPWLFLALVMMGSLVRAQDMAHALEANLRPIRAILELPDEQIRHFSS
jgi:hypothetical protein